MNAHANEIQASPAPPAPVSDGAAIISMIERAARDPAVDIEKFERLMAMRERMEARAAKIAFDGAMADAKSEIEPIVRNATGHNSAKFADLSAISKAIDHVLGKHGLSYRFRTAQTDRIFVTCILSHRGGHTEENTLGGPPDKTGNKNDIQAIGSTQKYLMRYTLEGAVGLSTTKEDDGRATGQPVGNASEPATIEAGEAAYVRQLLAETKSDEAKFLAAFKIASIEDLSPDGYKRALDMLNRKRANGAGK